jgi:membrane fusion protein (multidrug efflux system)
MRLRLIVGMMLCIHPGQVSVMAQSIAVQVHIAESTQGKAETVYHSLGEIVSAESVEITSTTPATIEKLLFRDGQEVKQGDPLVQMDRRVASTLLQNSESQLNLARQTLARTQGLYSKALRTQADLQRDTAALASAQADYDSKKTSLEVLTITAPFDGVLSERVASAGAFINPGQPIVRLQSNKKLQLRFKVPQYLLNSVMVGQAVRVSSNVTGGVLETRVSQIDAVLASDTRLLALQADITDPIGKLRAGTFVRVELVLSARDNAVLVPENAVNRALSGDFVFVADGGKAQRRAVTTGETKEGLTEILEGLGPGEKVITDGQFKLEDGGSIEVN